MRKDLEIHLKPSRPMTEQELKELKLKSFTSPNKRWIIDNNGKISIATSVR